MRTKIRFVRGQSAQFDESERVGKPPISIGYSGGVVRALNRRPVLLGRSTSQPSSSRRSIHAPPPLPRLVPYSSDWTRAPIGYSADGGDERLDRRDGIKSSAKVKTNRGIGTWLQ